MYKAFQRHTVNAPQISYHRDTHEVGGRRQDGKCEVGSKLWRDMCPFKKEKKRATGTS